MGRFVIVILAAMILPACGSDTRDAERLANEQQQAAEVEHKKQLEQAAEKLAAAAEKAVVAEQRQQAEAGQAFAVGPVEKTADKDPQKIVDSCLTLMGGREKVGAVKTLTAKAVLTGATNRSYNLTMEYPDKMLADFFGADGKIATAMLVTGERAYNLSRGHVVDMITPSLEDTLLSIRADPLCLMVELARGAPDFQLTYEGQAQVAGKRADVIRIAPPSSKQITAYFDAATHQLIGTRYQIAQGLVTVIDERFEQVDGVLVGIAGKQLIGSSVTKVTVSDLKLNPELPKGTFEAMKHELIK
jgi:hypothetical protein